MSDEKSMRDGDEQLRKLAVALKHESTGGPRVTASGVGKLAERLSEIARENDIPLVEDEDLARSLSLLDVGMQVPPELYDVVAEILAHVYHVSGKFRDRLE